MPEGIFGRDAELNAVSGFLAGLSAAPSALVVAGTAGAGKTRLLRESAGTGGRQWIHGSADAAHAQRHTAPFAGLADLLGSRFEEISAQAARAAAAGFANALPRESAPQSTAKAV
jgi:hypothetical protein